jgi:hypothetical protein
MANNTQSNQLWSNSNKQYPIDADIVTTNINAINTFSQSLGCNTLYINSPTLDNTAATALIYNTGTSYVEYCNNMLTTNLTQSVTNKTITDVSNNISANGLKSTTTTVNTSSSVAPSAGQVLTAVNGSSASWQTLSSIDTINDNTGFVFNNGDNTKKQNWNLGGSTTGTETTLVFSQTSNRNITFPDASDTLTGKVTVDILQNKSLDSSNCLIINHIDPSKTIKFDCGNNATGLSATILSQCSAQSQTYNLPNLSTSGDTFCTLGASQVLTNKTLTSPVISSINNTGVLTLSATTGVIPSGPNTTVSGNLVSYNSTNGQVIQDSGILSTNIVTLAGTQLLTNKSLVDTSTFIVGALDNTKQLIFNCGSAATNTTLTIVNQQTTGVGASLNIPNITTSPATMLVDNVAQTINSVKTFSSNPVISAITNTGTLTLPTTSCIIIGDVTTNTLTNKSLSDTTTAIINASDNTKQIKFNLSGNTTACSLTMFTSQAVSTNLIIPPIGSPSTMAMLELNQIFTGLNSMKFTTTGGTASILNYCEFYSANITWSGPWAVGKTANIYLNRLGNNVTLYCQNVVASAATGVSAISCPNSTIPARYLPGAVSGTIQNPIYPSECLATSNSLPVVSRVDINTSGNANIILYSNFAGAAFAGTGNAGFFEFSLSWVV